MAIIGLIASTFLVYGGPAGPPTGLNVNVLNEVSAFVKNSPSHPVPTEEHHTPYQRTLSWDNWGGEMYRSADFELPEGKMLIVETVGISAHVESGQSVKADVTFQSTGSSTFQA